ncbi:OmpA family protein [Corallococcus sicarius]|uniref:OmpA family protein n=1 Tax=Corallococcus sicarius TaxID=2316726 RepID=UPI001FCA12AB|nr:OmpA family protein [Corallococcus sicarius]
MALAGASALTVVGCAHGPPPSELTAAREAYHELTRSPEGRERPADVAAARVALQEAENEYADSEGSVRTRSLAYVALRKAEIADARGEADLAAQQRAQAEAALRQQQEARAQTLTRQQEEERARYEQQRLQYEQQRAQLEAQRQQYAQQQAQTEAQRQQELERIRTAEAQQRQQLEAENQQRLQQQTAEAQRLAQANQELQRRTQELEQERQARLQAEQRAAQALAQLQDKDLKVREEARGTVVTLSGSVLFASNAVDLLPSARDRLSDVATALQESQNPLLIEGHTDSRGTDDYNSQLSQRRAERVREFLISQGVPPNRIEIRGVGEDRPVATNDTAEGRANNRRVEIVMEHTPQPRTTGVGGSGAQQPGQNVQQPGPQGTQPSGQVPQPGVGTQQPSGMGTQPSGQGTQPGGTGGSGLGPNGIDHQNPAPPQGTGTDVQQQMPPPPRSTPGQ